MIVSPRHHQWSEVGHIVRKLMPASAMICWLFFSSSLHVMSSLSHFWPPISFAVIFFCAAFAPRLMPYFVLFVLGLLHDIIAMQPFGLAALQFVALRILITTQGRLITSFPFVMQWAVFSMATLLLLLAQWIVMGMHLGHVFPLSFATFPWLSVTALYPLVHRLLYPIYRNITLYEKRKQGWT